MKTQQNLAHFVDGIKLDVRLDTFEVRLLVPRREIVAYNQIYPNWHFIVQGLCYKVGFVDADLKVELALREVAIYDYTIKSKKSVAVSYA